jgi:hypothetical protein
LMHDMSSSGALIDSASFARPWHEPCRSPQRLLCLRSWIVGLHAIERVLQLREAVSALICNSCRQNQMSGSSYGSTKKASSRAPAKGSVNSNHLDNDDEDLEDGPLIPVATHAKPKASPLTVAFVVG